MAPPAAGVRGDGMALLAQMRGGCGNAGRGRVGRLPRRPWTHRKIVPWPRMCEGARRGCPCQPRACGEMAPLAADVRGMW